ncbi:hypothetical protein QA584_00350 [Anaerocolumna sp. AGMB13025]|uniref:hypothetical protein n=1 Tax=Anaerocolumna sp. AGMB13025 TaxID=3039116 RepID=UPI00241E5F2C|nr:hypothetical protein [Anaerocolumna sp. AGMB13025]WFR57567.1 hypothetical protein QA584_00350 [Anaerocolumna sp. AGMB13025]
MVQELFDKNIFSYIMLALCACGILLKLILNLVYSRLIKASDNMAKSKNKLTQMMKKKFETYYTLKIGVNNVDIFVDKYVFRHRICGILLSTWENIGGQILMLCLLIGSISTIIGLIYECGKQQILSTFSVGILTSGLLIFLEGLINLAGRKELIRLNMKDYFENILKVRLEQEQIQPELIEQYKKEYLREEAAQAMKSSELMAASSEQALKLSRKDKRDMLSKQKAERIRKKKQQKEAKSLEQAAKKAEAKAAIAKKKEEKELAKERKKLQKVQNRQKAREEDERIKKETKLALERKREAERAEIERIKAEVKASEERKKEEKHRQEEIKKALMLEKKALKEEKVKPQPVEYKTIAQERKENLKREIRERRNLEANEEAKDVILSNRQEDKIAAALMDGKPVEVKSFKENTGVEEKSPESVSASKADNEKINTNKTSMEKVNTERMNSEKVNIEKANIEKANAEKANIENIRAEKAYIEKANMETAHVEKANMEKVKVEKAQVFKTSTSLEPEVKNQAVKGDTSSTVKAKPVYNKKAKTTVSEDEKLIEDILKEFLA